MSAVDSYGSDDSGLVCGFYFDAHGQGHNVDGLQALHRLETARTAQQGFVWLHFSLSHTATRKWLRSQVQLPDEFHDLLSESSRSTRVERHDEALLAVVNDVRYDFAFEAADLATLWLYVGERLVVSARLQPLRAIDRLRDAVRHGERLPSSMALLVHLMHDQGDVLAGIVRATTQRVDDIEDTLLAGRLGAKRADLSALRRLLVRLQRLLAPEPASLFRLLHRPPDWIAQDDLADLRQSTEEFNVALSDMAALQERIKLLQEEIAARVAESDNHSLYVLTIVTVLALPINMIAGLLGMNVGGIPLADHPHGFVLVLLVVVVVTLLAAWFAFRKRGND
ncbi:transporter [Curvibacter sp. CHRR-16]|uniref:transporter n=1 Tax=Curvibacter sp. CHRR-16 TaxID=2835872 RepID=UPI001BDA4E1C|nr:transporter [Curvibacter sp. CHRR-16]MBT0570105.1 transporter [Curvibacter sp. CHRR-16]